MAPSSSISCRAAGAEVAAACRSRSCKGRNEPRATIRLAEMASFSSSSAA